jgi:hypothetical protein
MFKKIPALVLCATIGAAAGFSAVAPSPAHAGDDKPYDCGKFKKAKVKAACKGGANTEKKMRNQMKDWQKKAKDKGWDGKCTTCHEKSSGGELNSEGEKKWDEFAKHF